MPGLTRPSAPCDPPVMSNTTEDRRFRARTWARRAWDALRTAWAPLPSDPLTWIVLPRGPDESPAINAIRHQTDPAWRILRHRPGANQTLGTLLARARPHDRVLILDQGCMLVPNALETLAPHADATLTYADEDRIDPAGQRSDPFLKPAWSIDAALEQNLVGTLCATTKNALAPALDLKTPTPHAVALRLAQQPTTTLRHLPLILAHRPHPRSLAPPAAAIADTLLRLTTPRTIPEPIASTILPGRTRIRWRLPHPPRVTIIIPVRDNPALLARCTEGVLARTDYPDLELLIADNDSIEPETLALLARLAQDPRVRILPMPGPFNYSAINNAAAAQATGSVLVLLNSDVVVIDPDWLRELAGHAMRPDVGAVGAKLLFENGTIQHAGIVLGVGSFEGGPGIAGHFGLTAPGDAIGHGEQFVITREVAAVTAACLALRREIFEAVGGLDAVNLPVALNDLDLCLRIRERGLRIVFTPYAQLTHLESASRGPDTGASAERFRRECRHIRDRWGPTLDNDPFYNPNFSRYDHSFLLSSPSPPGTAPG